jgi:hypothetical protein
MSLQWQQLRPWKNSVNSGFEELCCQLAEYEPHPQGSAFVRKGTPDGGVECFWVFPAGSEWGWQAKFLFMPFGAAQWKQLDKSVDSALKSHTKLSRYTICLPFDRPDTRIKGQKSFLDQWNLRVKKWQARAKQLGMSVQFDYWGEHEIYERLSREEHVGRFKFWFDQEFLSEAWFSAHIHEVAANAGDRYTPELNVELPIAQVFEGLGRTPAFFSSLDSHLRSIGKALRQLPLTKIVAISETDALSVKENTEKLLRLLGTMQNHNWEQLPFADLGIAQIESSQRCLAVLRQREQESKKATAATAQAGQAPAVDLRNEIYAVGELYRSLRNLREFSQSASARSSNTPAVLIVGTAGSGKTHLLCDAAEQRIKSGYPTVVLLGQQFGATEPWKQILEFLGLSCTREQFLGAMDAAAQASGVRALIMIDALNEGEGQKIWGKYLAGMLAQLERYPRIGIAVSVRSSYEEVIVPAQLRSGDQLVREQHRGFEEHEYEAANRFSTHFGIEPSIPLLYPEFTSPQFLMLFCRGIRNKGLSRVPAGLHGISSIFEFYLDSLNDKLAHPDHLNFDAKERLVQNATDKITNLMAQKGQRWLPFDVAKKQIDTLLPGRQYEASLSRHLISEGVFAEDLFATDGNKEPARIIRFSYERFADHRIAKLMLDRHLNKKRPEASFKPSRPLGALLKEDSHWQNQGLIEALCIQLPEIVQRELPELAPHCSGLQAVRLAFLESLFWRKREAFADSTLKYINAEILTYSESFERFWDVMLTVAPVPGHPLNAGFLHKHLSKFSMPERDAWWSVYLHNRFGTQSAIDRLLDWAWSPLTSKQLDREAAVLYTTAIAWLLTSSNRYLRDEATKTLVKVIDSRIDVLLPVLNNFRSVNDPYVLERICGVAYACAMKSTNPTQLQELGQFVYDWIFAKGKPPSHLLTRDYARGVVEVALRRCPSFKIDASKARPPYGAAWPKAIPSESDLKARYGTRVDKMPDNEWARLAIYDSVLGFGDFARYVIGTNSGFFEWSSTRLGKRPAVSPQEKYDDFLKSLKGKKKKAWANLEHARSEVLFAGFAALMPKVKGKRKAGPQTDDTAKLRLEKASQSFEAMLDQTELRRYRKDVVPYLSGRTDRKDRFDLSIAQRWILQRVFDLGWTVEKFGRFDRDVNARAWDRSARKAERIGKKYQWIAYHEFLGLVADNFEYDNKLHDSKTKYVGPWQFFARDIDPSCAILDLPGTSTEREESRWWSPTAGYEWGAERDEEWIVHSKDLPVAERLIEVSNPDDGSEWLALEQYPEWRQEAPPSEDDFEKPRRRLWYQIRSYFVEKEHASKVFSWLSKQHFWGQWMAWRDEYHGTFLGEFHWAPALAGTETIIDPFAEREHSKLRDLPGPLVITSTTYSSRPNSFDRSGREPFNIYLPGKWLVEKMGLQWSGREGKFFDAVGDLVACDPAVSYPGPNALLVRKKQLMSFLDSSKYEVIWTLLGAKQMIGGGWSHEGWKGELQVSGVFTMKKGKIIGQLRPRVVKR